MILLGLKSNSLAHLCPWCEINAKDLKEKGLSRTISSITKQSTAWKANGEMKINAKFDTKTTKICNQIQSTVSNHEAACSNCLNRQSSCTTTGTTSTVTPGGIGCGLLSETTSAEVMSASFSNMNLTNPIRGLVSKKRNRYKQDGFNLDLTYITDKIIAMGYPASNVESFYRNNIDEVVKFLDQKHPEHYQVYNLCSERSYDKSKFHGRVQDFPFDDHNPPTVDSIAPFCQNVQAWLTQDPLNVAVVHCKAGKGRTGTMICCYLLHSGICRTAQEALQLYGKKRTQDTKGVTIPSQVRYVTYYEQLVSSNLDYTPTTVYIKEFIFEPPPTFIAGTSGSLCFSIWENLSGKRGEEDKCPQRQNLQFLKKSDIYKIPSDSPASFSIKLDFCLPLSGDVRIEFYNKVKMIRKEKLFHFWFNTFFASCIQNFTNSNHCGSDFLFHHHGDRGYAPEFYASNEVERESECHLVFRKHELDRLNKADKQHKMFSEKFKLTMVVQKTPRSSVTHPPPHALPIQVPDSTSSESSVESTDESFEDEDEDKDQWDSAGLDQLDPTGIGYRILSECEIAAQLTNQSNGASGGGGGDQKSEARPEILAPS